MEKHDSRYDLITMNYQFHPSLIKTATHQEVMNPKHKPEHWYGIPICQETRPQFPQVVLGHLECLKILRIAGLSRLVF
ncbi:hypothetical protein M8J77_001651 [Diaphorina citri]|nr:hypothetical protein M8J77_001651 [Diaphorina citri]